MTASFKSPKDWDTVGWDHWILKCHLSLQTTAGNQMGKERFIRVGEKVLLGQWFSKLSNNPEAC